MSVKIVSLKANQHTMIPKENFKLTGLKLDKKTYNANDQAAIDCGSLWQQFMGEAITGNLSTDIYAVYFEYEGDPTQPYSFFIGCKVDADAETPNGLQSIEIPNQNTP